MLVNAVLNHVGKQFLHKNRFKVPWIVELRSRDLYIEDLIKMIKKPLTFSRFSPPNNVFWDLFGVIGLSRAEITRNHEPGTNISLTSCCPSPSSIVWYIPLSFEFGRASVYFVPYSAIFALISNGSPSRSAGRIRATIVSSFKSPTTWWLSCGSAQICTEVGISWRYVWWVTADLGGFSVNSSLAIFSLRKPQKTLKLRKMNPLK